MDAKRMGGDKTNPLVNSRQVWARDLKFGIEARSPSSPVSKNIKIICTFSIIFAYVSIYYENLTKGKKW